MTIRNYTNLPGLCLGIGLSIESKFPCSKRYMRKHHLLIIDNDEDEFFIYMEAFRILKIPHECTWAKSGDIALNKLQDIKPDVIFLDYYMSGMDGIECLKKIRTIPGFNLTPIILQSHYMEDEIKFNGLKFGASSCIRKPDSLSKLIDNLESFMLKK